MRRKPFPLRDVLPPALHGVILDFHWDLDRLHALSLPEHDVSVEDLTWHLSLPFWAVDGEPFRVSPEQVAAEPTRYADQWSRVMSADHRHPLDTYVGSTGSSLTILDGIHRLLKAVVVGRRTLRVRTLRPEEFDAIAVPADA